MIFQRATVIMIIGIIIIIMEINNNCTIVSG
jgi:hypothetical protein